jgi:hypothetical protein
MAPVACAQPIGPINCRTAASRGDRPRRQYGTHGVSSLFDTHQATVTPGDRQLPVVKSRAVV